MRQPWSPWLEETETRSTKQDIVDNRHLKETPDLAAYGYLARERGDGGQSSAREADNSHKLTLPS